MYAYLKGAVTMLKYKSLIDYLLDADQVNLKKHSKGQFKSFKKSDWFMLFWVILTLGIMFYGVVILESLLDMHIILKILLMLSLIILYSMIYRSEKKSIENYKNEYSIYKIRLKGLHDTLKDDFNLETKEDIEILIQYCEDELAEKTSLNRLTTFLEKIVFRIFVPFFAFVVGLLFTDTTLATVKELFTLEGLFIFVLNVILYGFILLIFALGVYLFSDLVMYSMMITRKSKIKSLRSQLIDITLTEFID